MIFGETKVLGPYGLVEARDLKVGSTIWAWDQRCWHDARITRIERGQSRQAVIVSYHDGDTHKTLRCDPAHPFRLKAGARLTARCLRAGDRLLLSGGAHRFYGTVGPIERVELDEPETVYGISLEKPYKTALIEGFLCHV